MQHQIKQQVNTSLHALLAAAKRILARVARRASKDAAPEDWPPNR